MDGSRSWYNVPHMNIRVRYWTITFLASLRTRLSPLPQSGLYESTLYLFVHYAKFLLEEPIYRSRRTRTWLGSRGQVEIAWKYYRPLQGGEMPASVGLWSPRNRSGYIWGYYLPTKTSPFQIQLFGRSFSFCSVPDQVRFKRLLSELRRVRHRPIQGYSSVYSDILFVICVPCLVFSSRFSVFKSGTRIQLAIS